jgi:hypothetical protein
MRTVYDFDVKKVPYGTLEHLVAQGPNFIGNGFFET